MKTIKFTEDELQNIRNLYIEQNKTCKELAQTYNISVPSMQKILKQNNIYKKHQDKNYLSWLLNDEKMSYEQIADFLNVSPQTIKANLRTHGLIESPVTKNKLTPQNQLFKEAIDYGQYIDIHAAKDEYMAEFIPLLREKLSSCDSKIKLSVVYNGDGQVAIFNNKYIVDFIIPEVGMGYVLAPSSPNADKSLIDFDNQNTTVFIHNLGAPKINSDQDYAYALKRYFHNEHYSDTRAMKDVIDSLVENLLNRKGIRKNI